MSPLPSLAAYVAEVSRIHSAGMATEHSYRSAIMKLVGALTPNLVATNEPKRIACGAPDIILTEKDVPVGYIETKAPFDDDLEGRAANKEQFDRYLASLDKIVFTDFLRFRFYEHGEFKSEIVLGRMSNEIRKKWKAGESFLSDDIVPDAEEAEPQNLAGEIDISDIIDVDLPEVSLPDGDSPDDRFTNLQDPEEIEELTLF